MKRKHIILFLLILGATVFYFLSNHSSSMGKAVVKYPDKDQAMSTVKTWGPYDYYSLDWTISSGIDGNDFKVTGKGMSQFRMFGGSGYGNNYMHRNQLKLDKLNTMLESMELEQPYLIWISKNRKQGQDYKQFIMITKNGTLYKNENKLIELTKKIKNP